MAQYDVFRNPSGSAADGIPYVVVIQSDLLDGLATRLVMPLAVPDGSTKVPTALCPVIVELELTPFRGHLILKEKGVRYANDEAALPGGVQATDGRAGARRAQPGRAWATVQVQRTEHLDVGSARCGRQACAAALANPRARRAQ
jgi:hypothetical protein